MQYAITISAVSDSHCVAVVSRMDSEGDTVDVRGRLCATRAEAVATAVQNVRALRKAGRL